MSRPKQKKKKKMLPQIKKDIKNFCFSEEGKISKKTVAKIGLTIAALSASAQALEAHHGSNTHNQTANAFFDFGPGASGHQSGNVPTHASHPSHTSHGSHGQW